MHDGYCIVCGADELLNSEEECPRCYARAFRVRAEFDADELGLDPEEDDERYA